MDYALTLSIDGHPPALNGEQGLIRLHYRSYAQKRTEWETLILAALPADVRAFFQVLIELPCVESSAVNCVVGVPPLPLANLSLQADIPVEGGLGDAHCLADFLDCDRKI